jgi:predicted Zn-dependent protease with MMP-like domain
MDDPGSSDPRAWRNLRAPSLAEFELLADFAFRRLPQKFRTLCEGLVIRVEDFPEEKVLDELGVARWSLRLLEEKVVELHIVERASDNTIGRTLKKTFSSRIASSNG